MHGVDVTTLMSFADDVALGDVSQEGADYDEGLVALLVAMASSSLLSVLLYSTLLYSALYSLFFCRVLSSSCTSHF